MSLLDTLIARSVPLLPKFVVRRVASRYVAGETLDEAVAVIRRLNAEGCRATVDLLGEFVKDAAEARANADAYSGIVDRLDSEKLDANVSISHYLFGRLLTVSTADLWITLALSLAGTAWVWRRFEDLKFSTFDRDHAMQVGIRVQRLDASMLVLLAACVVVCLNTVGIALTVSLLITPSATARLFADRAGAVTVSAVGIGLAYVLSGFVVAYHTDLAPGPVITVLGTAVFITCYAARYRRAERTYVHHTHRHDGHVH